MNSDNEETKLSESMRKFLKDYSISDLRSMVKNLDQKIDLAKNGKAMAEEEMDSLTAEIASIEKHNENTKLQIAESRKRIVKYRERLENIRAEKEAAEQAELQRQQQEKHSGMSKEEKLKLNEKLNEQYTKIDDLEDKLEKLKMQKAETQKEFTDYRATLKDQKSILSQMSADYENIVERREYLLASFHELQNIVKDLCESIDRLKFKLENPVEQESDSGKSLFDEVTADKKKLETDLINLVDSTNHFRQKIRQTQDEIDEIDANETENTSIVDIDYVLSKMHQLENKADEINAAMKQIENEVIACVSQIEGFAQPEEGDKIEFGAQYIALRDYGIECIRMKSHECSVGIAKLKELFYEFEQISIEYTQCRERARDL